MSLMTRSFGAGMDPESDDLINQEVAKISRQFQISIEKWLVVSGVTLDNTNEFELEYDTIKQIYHLRQNGEVISCLAIIGMSSGECVDFHGK